MTAAARPVLNNPMPLYVVGLFSMGYIDFYIFLIPLYCLSLGMSAGEIGTIVGARSALAVFLSIHIGVLMDRFGTRRVTLFFVWTGDLPRAGFPAGAVVLAVVAAADRQWRRAVLCLVGVADLDRATGRGRGRVYRPVQLLCAHRHRLSRRSSSAPLGIWAAPGRPI